MKKKITAKDLFDFIRPEGTEWNEIRSFIETYYREPKNWITEVRNPLQNLIDRGFVVREKNIHVERYVRIV